MAMCNGLFGIIYIYLNITLIAAVGLLEWPLTSRQLQQGDTGGGSRIGFKSSNGGSGSPVLHIPEAAHCTVVNVGCGGERGGGDGPVPVAVARSTKTAQPRDKWKPPPNLPTLGARFSCPPAEEQHGCAGGAGREGPSKDLEPPPQAARRCSQGCRQAPGSERKPRPLRCRTQTSLDSAPSGVWEGLPAPAGSGVSAPAAWPLPTPSTCSDLGAGLRPSPGTVTAWPGM